MYPTSQVMLSRKFSACFAGFLVEICIYYKYMSV